MVVRGTNARSRRRRASAARGSSSPAVLGASARDRHRVRRRGRLASRSSTGSSTRRNRSPTRSAGIAVDCDLADAGAHDRRDAARRSTISAASTCSSTTPACSGSRRCSTSRADEWDWIFAINVRAMLLTTQVAARAMIAQGDGGKIVNMASMGGKVGAAGPGALRGVEGGRHLAHPGVGRRTRRPRDHRELDLSRLRAHRDGRRDPHRRDGRRMVGEVAARPARRPVRRGRRWPCSWRRATPTTAPDRR